MQSQNTLPGKKTNGKWCTLKWNDRFFLWVVLNLIFLIDIPIIELCFWKAPSKLQTICYQTNQNTFVSFFSTPYLLPFCWLIQKLWLNTRMDRIRFGPHRSIIFPSCVSTAPTVKAEWDDEERLFDILILIDYSFVWCWNRRQLHGEENLGLMTPRAIHQSSQLVHDDDCEFSCVNQMASIIYLYGLKYGSWSCAAICLVLFSNEFLYS